MRNYNNSADVNFFIGEEIVGSKSIDLSPKEVAKIGFQTKPKAGIHQVSIGDTIPLIVEVYPFYSVESLNMICAHTHRGQRGSANLTLIRKIIVTPLQPVALISFTLKSHMGQSI